jgi:hypothetical protein
MGEVMIQVLAIGFAACVVWAIFLHPSCVLEIRIAGGEPSIRKGKVTAAFLGRVGVVCRESGVARGWIRGVPQGRRVALRFSSNFPPGAQQRLRNEWALAD